METTKNKKWMSRPHILFFIPIFHAILTHIKHNMAEMKSKNPS